VLTDAHCHPSDLIRVFPQAEKERKDLGVLAAASACDPQEFSYHEELARNSSAEKTAPLLCCFGIHPQLPAERAKKSLTFTEKDMDKNMAFLDKLCQAGKIAAIGECGFDLYKDEYRETESIQEKIFEGHLETAIKFNLPVVIHARRAMHKIFAYEKQLSKCKTIIFHTWPGTLEEGKSLLRHGINAYFSFGNVIMLNHKQSIKCCSLLPAERLLTETDAPYAPRRGENFSSWTDLPLILETAVNLRSEAGNKTTGKDLENQIDMNFMKAFVL